MSDAVKLAFAARMQKMAKSRDSIGQEISIIPPPTVQPTKPLELPIKSSASAEPSVAQLPSPPPVAIRRSMTSSESPRSPASEPFSPMAGILSNSETIKLEGWLMKLSTGRLSRWQKRWFILSNGSLSYSRAPSESVNKAIYPLSACGGVVHVKTGKLPEKQFDLLFKNGEKILHLEALTGSDSLKWTAAIESALSLQTPGNDVEIDFDETESVASVRVDVDSAKNSVLVPREETVWEELDGDALDRKFANWFAVVESGRVGGLGVRGGVVEAANKAIEDFWSTLNLEKIPTASERAKRTAAVAVEYSSRLASSVGGWLDLNSSVLSSETMLPTSLSLYGILLEFREKASAVIEGGKLKDSSPSRRSLPNALAALSNSIDLLAAEIEVGLIERIRQKIQSDSVWENSTVNHSKLSGLSTHGPAILFSSLCPEKPLFLTSWFPAFAAAVGSGGVETGGVRKKFPGASAGLGELWASALVACTNTAWRLYQRRVLRESSEIAENERLKKLGFWERWKNPRNFQTINWGCENSLAFANETSLMADLCTKSKDSEFPEIYKNCLDGLSTAFAGLRVQVLRRMVLSKLESICQSQAVKFFRNKKLVSEGTYSVMRGFLPLVRGFLSEVVVAAHDDVESRIITETMRGVISIYCVGFGSASLKLKSVPNLTQVMVQDEVAFAEFFAKHYNRLANETRPFVEPITKLRSILSSQSPVKLLPTTSAYFVKLLGEEKANIVALGICDCLDLSKNEKQIVERALSDAVNAEARNK